MNNSKFITFLRRPVFSRRRYLFIEASAAIIGVVGFTVSGLFMVLWGNLVGVLWPIPQNPTPLWIRIPIGIVLIFISVYFFKYAKTTIKRMSLLRKQNKRNFNLHCVAREIYSLSVFHIL
jgi:sterol desaturase/sphingolipid hydroxylase (fatty acid hydroxylase superfamily)